jgi:hypothetical protein
MQWDLSCAYHARYESADKKLVIPAQAGIQPMPRLRQKKFVWTGFPMKLRRQKRRRFWAKLTRE